MALNADKDQHHDHQHQEGHEQAPESQLHTLKALHPAAAGRLFTLERHGCAVKRQGVVDQHHADQALGTLVAQSGGQVFVAQHLLQRAWQAFHISFISPGAMFNLRHCGPLVNAGGDIDGLNQALIRLGFAFRLIHDSNC